MASAMLIQVSGPGGSISLAKSCTELTVGEATDQISGLSLGEVWEGQVINQYQGTYTAGTAIVWVTDNRTKQRFLLGCVNIVTGGNSPLYPPIPIRVTKDMVLEIMTQAVV